MMMLDLKKFLPDRQEIPSLRTFGVLLMIPDWAPICECPYGDVSAYSNLTAKNATLSQFSRSGNAHWAAITVFLPISQLWAI